jgi:hypothetical protein
MFSFGSAAVTWSSKKQPTVALSSTEAEYRGAAMAACEVAWLRKLLGDLGLHVDRHVVIYCDNLSIIQLARNPVFHARTKHIEVHYHFIREKVLAGEIDLIYVSTEDQVADIFTKVLGAEKHRRFHNMLGVMELELSLRGSVEMSSSTKADTHDVPQGPFYFLARLMTVLHFGTLSDRSKFIPTTCSRLFLATACLEGLVVVNEVLSLALCLCLLLLEMS